MTFDLIHSPEDVEILRRIRNTCRAGFAHDNHVITEGEQAEWWHRNALRLRGFLYRTATGEAVGYGLLRQTDDGRWWSSVAVVPWRGGQGYGKTITRLLVRQSPTGVVYAQARKDQPAAMALHCREDWDVVGEDDRLMHYQTKAELPDL